MTATSDAGKVASATDAARVRPATDAARVRPAIDRDQDRPEDARGMREHPAAAAVAAPLGAHTCWAS
ncbi:hypothetical protein STENM327S_01686 [Streptomyces tendae]